jgi:hypothetical protein
MWLLICNLLPTPDRRSLAWTCRDLWVLVSTLAPYLKLHIRGSGIFKLVRLHQISSILKSATKVHWSIPRSESKRWNHPFTPIEQSARFIFRILSSSSFIRSLELSQVEVSPSNQRAILSISTLRELILHSSVFIPTAVPLPSTSINSLVLKSLDLSLAGVEHLFKILADTLETAHVDMHCFGIYEFPSTVPLLHLKSIAMHEIMLHNEVHLMRPLFTQVGITTLLVEPDINLNHIQPLSTLPSFLPQLRHLSAPLHVAKSLIHGRPVQVFRDIQVTWMDTCNLESELSCFATSTRHIEELKLSMDIVPPYFIESIFKYAPHLQRLCVVLRAYSRYLDAPAVLRVIGTTIGSGHVTLKELEIRMELIGKSSSIREIKIHGHRVLHQLILTCAALELMKVTLVFLPSRGLEYWTMPVSCLLKLWKMPNGQWEERVFNQGEEYE